MNTKSTPNCSQCGSPLILVSTVTEHMEGAQFPQTSSTYRCSNQECQDEKDHQTSIRIKQKEERDLATQRRQEENQRRKKASDSLGS